MNMFDYLEYCWWYSKLVIKSWLTRPFHKHDWVGVIEIPQGEIGMMHVPESHLVAICLNCGDWKVFCEGTYPTSESSVAWAAKQPTSDESGETSPTVAPESKSAQVQPSKAQE